MEATLMPVEELDQQAGEALVVHAWRTEQLRRLGLTRPSPKRSTTSSTGTR
jgi:hypothetical protein